MKKTCIALLLAVLMLCQLTAASAAELIGVGSSLYLSESSGMTVADFLATPQTRAYATWYGVLEFCDVFGKSYADLDMSQDSFVKSTTLGELHIYLPACNAQGYYDLLWAEKTALLTLCFEPADSTVLRYDPDTFLNDSFPDMNSASDDVSAMYDHEWR